MMDEFIDIINKNKKIVFLPKPDKEYYNAFSNMYGECFVFDDNDISDYKLIVDKINNSSLAEIFFVNFTNIYRKIMPEISKKIKINSIITTNVGNLTNIYVLPIFYDITEFYERKLIGKIYALDKSMYEILKKASYNVERCKIILPFDDKNLKLNNKRSNSIGILSNDYEPVHNFYNMLTAISLLDKYDKVKIISHMDATYDFFNHFDIKYEFCDNIDDVMNNNFVNLYCNFTNTNPCIVIKSMDQGIPCILGNTDIFDNNSFLKDILVLNSDDNVNEIADKLKSVKDNYDKIFDEYKKWRNDNKQN